MNEELIAKAKETKSVEELLALAKENEIELTEERAKEFFEQFHESGALSDEELDMVGGGCSTKVGDKEYTVVTNHTKCFTGRYQIGYVFEFSVLDMIDHESRKPKRQDFYSLRQTWLVPGDEAKCGSCYWLEFKSGTGFCGMSGK